MGKRTFLNKMQIHTLVSFLLEKANGEKSISGTVSALAEEASKALEFDISYDNMRSCLKDLGISSQQIRQKKPKMCEQINRIKLIEKFIAQNFPHEWANMKP